MTSDNSQEGAESDPPLLGSSRGHTFESWWEQSGSVYAAAVEAAGGPCWTQELEERRALWERRYQRPDPPALPTIKDIKSFQKTNYVEGGHGTAFHVPCGQTPGGHRHRPMAVSQPISEDLLDDISA